MEKRCKYCNKLVEGNAKRKYCSDSCRSLNWKSIKSLKKDSDRKAKLIDKVIPVDQSIIDLFNLINRAN